MPSGKFGSGLNSLGDEDDPLMWEATVRVASLSRAEFNLSIVLFEIEELESGCSIQSLVKIPPRCCSIVAYQIIHFMMQRWVRLNHRI